MKTLLLTLLMWPTGTPGQPVVVQEALRDLSSDAVILNLAAHPDDEDGTTLSYYSKALGVTAHSVFFTRGEGGQNELGAELYEDLAVLRTSETLRAARILGTRVWFLNFEDFGYSKTAGEALRTWGGTGEVVRRLVYLIRRLRPDVLFTNHNTIDGHGQHQAVAVAAIAAFDAAADPRAYPEQLAEVLPWQPQKLYFRVWGRERPSVVHPVLDTIPLYGKAPIDFAAEALRQHESQGMVRANLRGWVESRGGAAYRLVRASLPFEADSTSFLDGLRIPETPEYAPLRIIRSRMTRLFRQTSLNLIREVSALQQRIDGLQAGSREDPLADRLLESWDRKLGRLLTAALNLDVRVTLSDSVLVWGQKATGIVALQTNMEGLDSVRVDFSLPDGWFSDAFEPVARKGRVEIGFELRAGRHVPYTLPAGRGLAWETRPSIDVLVTLYVNGLPVRIVSPCGYEAAPRHILSIRPSILWAAPRRPGNGIPVRWEVLNRLPHPTAGTVRVSAPAGWRSDNGEFVIATEDGMAEGIVRLFPPPDAGEGSYPVSVTTGEDTVGGVVSMIDATLPAGLRVGLFRSHDTTMLRAALWLGADVTELDSVSLDSTDLSVFRTVVLDARTMLFRPDLRRAAPRLLEWVRRGGHLVVFHQAPQEWDPAYAPYHLQLSRVRVSDEAAAITVLDTASVLLHRPNRVRPADWSGWKQERGLMFPSEADPRYTRVLSVGDPGEPARDTGLLLAESGRGSYLYTSLVWYRQLRDGHPGAFRMLANMLAYPLMR